MHFIHSKKIAYSFVVAFLFISNNVFCQEKNLLLLKEKKKVSFGIGLGIGSHSLRIDKNKNFIASDSVLGINPITAPGFFAQFLVNYNLSKHFALRSSFPSFHYSYYQIEYTDKYPTVQTKSFSFDHFKIGAPLDIVFKSDIINNFRFYIYAGGYANYNFANNQSSKAVPFLRIQKIDYGIQGGFGFLFNGELSIIGIELKYQYGMSNVFIKDPNLIYSNILETLRTENILLIINFM